MVYTQCKCAHFPLQYEYICKWMQFCRNLLLYLFVWYKMCWWNLQHVKRRFYYTAFEKAAIIQLSSHKGFICSKTSHNNALPQMEIIDSVNCHKITSISCLFSSQLHRVWWMKYPHKPITEPKSEWKKSTSGHQDENNLISACNWKFLHSAKCPFLNLRPD